MGVSIRVSETVAEAALELGDAMSALQQSSHESRDLTPGEAVGAAKSVLSLDRNEQNSPQFCTEFCHLNPNPIFCVLEALQSLMKVY